MTTQNNENTETVASAQPFLEAEKKQMEKLTEAAQDIGKTTQETSEIPPEIQAKLDRLKEIEDAEKEKQEPLIEELEEEGRARPDVSPEIQAKLDRLKEIEDAEKAEQEDAEKDPDYIKFNKPYMFEGKEYKGIKLEFDEMTGADILEAEEEFITKKTQTAAQTPLKELSKGYLAFFAARACAQPVDFILGLDGKTFARITRKAQSFLLAEG